MAEISAVGTAFVYVPDVRPFRDGAEPADVTTLPVRMAFLPDGQDPIETDWLPASWTPLAPAPEARCLVGPDGGVVTLTRGVYVIWLDVTGTSERPKEPVGKLVVR